MKGGAGSNAPNADGCPGGGGGGGSSKGTIVKPGDGRTPGNNADPLRQGAGVGGGAKSKGMPGVCTSFNAKHIIRFMGEGEYTAMGYT